MTLKLMTPEELSAQPPKILVYGQTGAGKSTMASELACGIREVLGSDKPVFLLDTEERAQAVVQNIYNPKGVPVKIAQSRSVYDAAELFKMARNQASVIVIDQATHLWTDLQEAWKKKKGRSFLTRNEWGIVKPIWRKNLLDPFLYTNIPTVIVARGKNELAEEIDEEKSAETGRDETKLVNKGIQAKLEGDSAYEAYLMIMMTAEANPNFSPTAKKKENQQRFVIHATVAKDNFGGVHGQIFKLPTFKDFLPHFEKIGLKQGIELRAERKPIETAPEQIENLYGDGSGYDSKKKATELEKIKDNLTLLFPARDKVGKVAVIETMKAIAGTSAWSEWQGRSLTDLAWYREVLDQLIKEKRADNWPTEALKIEEFVKGVMSQLALLKEANAAAGAEVLQTPDDDERLPWEQESDSNASDAPIDTQPDIQGVEGHCDIQPAPTTGLFA